MDYILYGDYSLVLSVLLQDCNGIPIYTGLEETAELSSKCFETTGPINVCFKKHTDMH
jgi:hypothetical protein